MSNAIATAHIASTLAMVGVIWVIQLVHYPTFADVDVGRFSGFHATHSAMISVIVVPLMLIELGTAGLLLLDAPGWYPRPWQALGAVLLVVAWGSTFFVQVPQHGALSSGYDAATIEALVRSNWIRTVAWTVRGGLIVVLLARLIQAAATVPDS